MLPDPTPPEPEPLPPEPEPLPPEPLEDPLFDELEGGKNYIGPASLTGIGL